MTASSNLQGPLSVGNVVSAGLQLYSSHFKQYFGVALRATLWGLLPFVAVIVVGIVFAVMQIDNEGLFFLLLPIWIGLALYGIGKYMAGSAAITRLAFGELTNQPEATGEARRFTNSRLWAFWGVSLLVGLLYFVIFIAAYILIAIVAVGLFAAAGGFNVANTSYDRWIAENPALVIALALVVLLLISALLLLIFWFMARFAIADAPLAIENEVGVLRSVGRGWQLTKKSAWRVLLVLLVTFLITVPLQIFVQVFTSILQGALVAILPNTSSVYSLVSFAVTYAFSLVAGVFLLPLWQAIKAVLYYDLRSRREGLGLQLRNREV